MKTLIKIYLSKKLFLIITIKPKNTPILFIFVNKPRTVEPTNTSHRTSAIRQYINITIAHVLKPAATTTSKGPRRNQPEPKFPQNRREILRPRNSLLFSSAAKVPDSDIVPIVGNDTQPSSRIVLRDPGSGICPFPVYNHLLASSRNGSLRTTFGRESDSARFLNFPPSRFRRLVFEFSQAALR